jgi:ribosomal protein S18 acetylase RimI-like enzyme
MGRSRQRWRRIDPKIIPQAEEFLKARELYCVSACAKFLQLKSSGDKAWFLQDGEGKVSALLLLSGRTLFPVISPGAGDWSAPGGGFYSGDAERPPREDLWSAAIPAPHFMSRLWGKFPIYGVQGRREDMEIIEGIMARHRYKISERIEYDLMRMKGPPNPEALGAGPAGLRIRRPRPSDMDALYLLQAGYEQEEVLPQGAPFNPAYCRMTLENLAAREQLLAAELDGRLVGKINTSARAFSRCQIGGVYVHPDYRGRGIALSMTAAFAGFLDGACRELTLFVKKRNAAARAVYRKTGFAFAGDYRISYYAPRGGAFEVPVGGEGRNPSYMR